MQYLYLIKCQQYYKIGITDDIEKRMGNIITNNPFPIELVFQHSSRYAKNIEYTLHEKYKSKNVSREWFELSSKDVQDIKNICLDAGQNLFDAKNKAMFSVVQTMLNWFLSWLLKNSNGEIRKYENAEYYEIRLPTRIWKHDNGVFVLSESESK